MVKSLAVMASILFALHVCAASATQPIWKSESFVIGYWCGPPAKFTTLDRYKEIADAGFTIAFPPCSGTSVETNRKILDYCQQVGLKALITDSRIPVSLSDDPKVRAGVDGVVADYAKHPALAGYFIADEPGPGAYPSLGQVVDYLRQRDPPHYGFINLLPNYAPEWAIGESYEQYVRGFVEQVKPAVISYDHYGFAAGATESFFENLAVVRKVSLEIGVPFWNIILSTQHGPYRNLTEGELRFETMNTLAYGAKGMLWFTYWSPAESDKSFDWKHALINEDGSRDPHYEMVKTINHEAQAIGTELLKAESREVSTTKTWHRPELLIDADARIGLFQTADHKIIAMIVNASWEKPLSTHASLGTGIAQAQVFDRAKRQWIPVAGPTVPIELSAGDGMLMRWSQ